MDKTLKKWKRQFFIRLWKCVTSINSEVFLKIPKRILCLLQFPLRIKTMTLNICGWSEQGQVNKMWPFKTKDKKWQIELFSYFLFWSFLCSCCWQNKKRKKKFHKNEKLYFKSKFQNLNIVEHFFSRTKMADNHCFVGRREVGKTRF